MTMRRAAVGSSVLALVWSGAVIPAAAAAGAAAAVVAPVPGVPPDEGRYVNVPVPDTGILTEGGATSLSRIWARGPVLLTLVFTRCAGVCSPYLRSLRAAADALGPPAGVTHVVLSFDPRDTVDDMRRTAAHLGVAGRAEWVFGVAAPQDLARLAHALGFWFQWDDARGQFDHPAMLAAIRTGRVRRLLVGGEVSRVRLGEAYAEARGLFVPSYPLPGNVRFRCFDYDPASGTATVTWGSLVLVVPACVAAIATGVLFRRPRRGLTTRPFASR